VNDDGPREGVPMRFRFTAGWAQMLVALGVVFLVLGVLLTAGAATLPIPWRQQPLGSIERASLAAMLFAGGVVLGGAFIVAGQLILALLNIRENVERLVVRLAGEDDVPCRYCGEDIKPDATVCRHCKSDLTRPTAADRLLAPRYTDQAPR
jgi:hypothetical protein